MDLNVYKAAKEGNVDFLGQHKEQLHEILTPTKSTVLHIYVACAMMSTNPEQAANIVEKIAEMCPPLLWQSSQNGDTALHVAARNGFTTIVKRLIELAPKFRAPHGDLENGRSIQEEEEEEEACAPKFIMIRAINNEGDTPLHEAVRFNHLGVVKMLTAEDPEFYYSGNATEETPLYLAVERRYRDLVFQILDTCINPSYQGPNGRTALHAAVIWNDQEITRKILEKKLELTKAVDEEGCTPLHLAASLGYASIVKQLLKCDRSSAYVREKYQQRTALHFAASGGHEDVMKQLITECPDCCELVDHKLRNVLHCAIDGFCFHSAHSLVLKDPWLSEVLLNRKDEHGNTPLHQLAATSPFRFMRFCNSVLTVARIDKMSFNKENQNALDIFRCEEIKNNSQVPLKQRKRKFTANLKRNGVIPGCRIGSKKIVDEIAKNNKAQEGDCKLADSVLIVATLIATVSFAAFLSIPYPSEKEPDQGLAISTRRIAFQTFVITNTIAMTLSSCSVLVHLYLGLFGKRKIISEISQSMAGFTMLALFALVIAFIAGTYALLGNSSAMAVSGISCFLFFGLFETMVYQGRIEGPNFVALVFLHEIILWLIESMVSGIIRLYKCFRDLAHPLASSLVFFRT